MDQPQATARVKPAKPVDREAQDRALDEALEQSFPASDTPSMLRPHGRSAGVLSR